MSIRDLFDEYKRDYLPARNYAPKTRLDYARDVDELVRFLHDKNVTDAQQINLGTLNSFLAHLDSRGLSGVSRRRKTYALKTFFEFLEQHKHVTENVSLRLVPPSIEQHEPRVLTEDEYKRLQLAVAHQTRDAAIIELLLQTGIRLGEIAKLTLQDVRLPTKITQDPDNTGELHIRQGKGRKDRRLALNYKACRALKAYLQVKPADSSTPALFVSKFKKPITPRGYEWIIAKYFEAAGIEDASVHALRHTFGTHMVKNGSNLRTVQEMMGHNDLATTSIYVSLARDMMNKDVQKNAL